LTNKIVLDFGGAGILSRKKSCLGILRSVFPQFVWSPEEFCRVWKTKPENQNSILEKIGIFWKISIFQDWEHVDFKKIRRTGKFFPTFLAMFREIYPEFYWDPFARRKVPRNFWRIKEKQQDAIFILQNYFSLQDKKDWYRLSLEQVSLVFHRSVGKTELLKMVKTVFPDEDWNSTEFSRKNKKSRQRWLFLKIKELFPENLVIEDFHHVDIKRNSGVFMELDIYLPEKNLAFEFQGEQHYKEIPSAGFSNFQVREECDREKMELCFENGIKLIIIPFWWDNKVESLARTIFQEYSKEFAELGTSVEKDDKKCEINLHLIPF